MYICCKTREAFFDSPAILLKSRFVTRLQSVAWPTSSYAVTTLIGFPYRNKAEPSFPRCQSCLPDSCTYLNLHSRFSLFPGEVSHQSCTHSESLPPSPLQDGMEIKCLGREAVTSRRTLKLIYFIFLHLFHIHSCLCLYQLPCPWAYFTFTGGLFRTSAISLHVWTIHSVKYTLFGIQKASDSNNCKSNVGSKSWDNFSSQIW